MKKHRFLNFHELTSLKHLNLNVNPSQYKHQYTCLVFSNKKDNRIAEGCGAEQLDMITWSQ